MKASTEAQVLSLWDTYSDEYEFVDEDGEVYDADKRKEYRRSRIDTIQALITEFRNGDLTVQEFKKAIDGENKQNPYWGFVGTGQMFFNQLVSRAEETDRVEEVASLLRELLDPPAGPGPAAERIEQLCDYVPVFEDAVESKQKLPSPGYVPMFLSYFWHIQERARIPIYYKKSREAFLNLDIWEEADEMGESYETFWETHRNSRQLIESNRDTEIELWDLEYALLRYANREEEDEGRGEPQRPAGGEPTLWLVATGSKSDNLNRTVTNQVDLSTVRRHSEIDLDVEGSTIPIWGHTSGADEGPDVAEGDIMLLYRRGTYRYAATLLAQEQNNSLGNAIWESSADDDEFTQIFYLTELRELDLDNEQFNAIVDYAPNYYQQGFTNPNQEAITLLEEKFGGIEAFVEAVARDEIYGQYRRIAEQLETTGQVIFYGPPGTGKTFHAKEFADWWINEYPGTRQLNDQVQIVTFHPSFTYEDFIEGLTAKSEDGQITYELADGVFKRFCDNVRAWDGQEKTTEEDMEQEPRYILIIDEINRGNVASILGETVTLLEKDKRAGGENPLTVRLAHSDEEFEIPSNIYLIGTMNTADRSIALVDAAIRRRFGFIPFPPDYSAIRENFGFESPEEVQDALTDDELAGLRALSITALRVLNDRIRERGDLGRGKQIGHSYLLGCDSEDELVRAWKFEILPLLEEYFFGSFSELTTALFDVEHADYLFDMKYEQIRSTFGEPEHTKPTPSEADALRTVLREITNGD